MELHRFLDNPFESTRITPPRLYAFGKDVASRLRMEKKDPFVSWLAGLEGPLNLFGAEIGEIDLSLIDQKAATQTADGFIASFKSIMTLAQPAIQVAFKGKNTVGFKSFFPKGLAEYTEAPKGQLDTLTKRLGALATEHADKLDPALVGQLQELNSTWKSLEGTQSATRKGTKENRTERTAARRELEVQLFKVLLGLGAHFAADKASALKFFDATLLDTPANVSKRAKKDPVA